MIEVKNLTKKYDKTIAVDNISFEINDGEIVGFLGPNGAGKTTTMNMLTGFIEPTSGKVLINGYDIDTKPKMAKKQFGYMPENVPLYGDLTVTEFISYMADLKLVPRKEKKAEIARVIKEAGLESVKNKLTKNLSRGYKQRTSLAGALVGNPKILILDEPTVGLDPKQVTEIRNFIKDLGKKHTVLVSSHILSEISQMCSKVIILKEGKIVAIDSAENLEEVTSGGLELLVTVEEKNPNFDKIKNKIPSIESIVKQDNVNDSDEEIYVVRCKDKTDIRKEFLKQCANEDITILEIHKRESSLEEAFLKITEDKEDK